MINGYTETSPGIFHSGMISVSDIPVIRELTRQRVAIFNVSDQHTELWLPVGWKYFWFNMLDSPDISPVTEGGPPTCFPVSEGPPQVVREYINIGYWIRQMHMRGFACWIHCWQGCNRSTMANIAYRSGEFGETGPDAFAKIKALRQCVNLTPEHNQILHYFKGR